MAYTIHKYPSGEMVSSGQTRQQVVRALVEHYLLRSDEACPRMPKHGQETLVVRWHGDVRGSFTIRNV